MKRFVKILVTGLSVLVAVILVLAVLTPLVVRTDFVKTRVLKAVNREIAPLAADFDSLSLSYGTEVSITGLRLTGPEGNILAVEKISAGPLFPGLLQKDRVLKEILVLSPEVFLEKEANGSWNAESWRPAPRPETGEKPEQKPAEGSFSIQDITIENGLLHVRALGPQGAEVFSALADFSLSGALTPDRFVLRDARVRDRANGQAGVILDGAAPLAADGPVTLNARAGAEELTPYQALVPAIPGLAGFALTANISETLKKPRLRLASGFAPNQSVNGTMGLDLSADVPKGRGKIALRNLLTASFSPGLDAVLSADLAGSFSGDPLKDGGFQGTVDLLPSRVAHVDPVEGRVDLDLDHGLLKSFAASLASPGGGADISGFGELAGLTAKAEPATLSITGTIENLRPGYFAKNPKIRGEISGAIRLEAQKAPDRALADSAALLILNLSQANVGRAAFKSGEIRARLAGRAITVEKGELAFEGGRAAFSGKSDFSGRGNATLDLWVNRLGPAAGWFLADPVAGSLTASARAVGNLAKPALNLAVQAGKAAFRDFSVEAAELVFNGDLSALSGAAALTATQVSIQGRPAERIEASASGDQKAVDLTLAVKKFSDADIQLAARVEDPAEPQKTVTARTLSLDWNQEHWANTGPLVLVLGPDRVEAKSFALESGSQRMSLSGVYVYDGPSDLALDISALHLPLVSKLLALDPPIKGTLDLKTRVLGTPQSPEIQITSDIRDLTRGQGLPQADASLQAAYKNKSAVAEVRMTHDHRGALEARATLPVDLSLPLKTGWLPARSLSADITGTALDLALVSELASMDPPLTGTADLLARLEGSLESPRFSARTAVNKLARTKSVPSVDADLSVDYDGRVLSAKADAAPLSGGTLTALASLPVALSIPMKDGWLPASGLAAELTGTRLSLDFLPEITPYVEKADALLNLSARAKGDPLRPETTGSASLTATDLEVAGWSDPLHGVDLALEWDENQARITRGELKTGKEGVFTLTGWADYGGYTLGGMQVKVQAYKLDVAHRGYIQARTNAGLLVEGRWPDITVNGNLTVGQGTLRLDRFLAVTRPGVALDGDVVMEGQEPPKKEPSILDPLKADVSLVVDGPFWVKGEGAQVQVAGDLTAKVARGRSDVVLAGYMETVRGLYEFKGKAFSIEKGRLDFLGQTPPDPLLDVQAAYRVSNVTIYLNIGGTASQMTLALTSDPAMDETDIASYLLFGKKASDLTQGESSSLVDKGAAFLGAQAVSELKTQLGEAPVDLITLESGGDSGQTTLVVGKYVTPDLFVLYRRGLGEEGGNEIQVEYRFLPHFTLESDVSEETSGVDVFWNYDY